MKVSKVEVIKRESRHLRGTIEQALQDGSPRFEEDNVQVLKFHGVYQQDDRDLRAKLRKEGKDKHYMMMVRARIPGGRMTAQQYLAFDEIADRYGMGSLRITTRQTFQLHGILKGNLKATIRGIHNALITTLGGCGDQVRNINACPEPVEDEFHRQIDEDLQALVDRFGAKTNAYHEIWLDGEKVTPDVEADEEPLYGDVYLPRKFKVGIAPEGDNCIDVYANDIGLVAHRSGDAVAGYTVLVGGGMGRTAAVKDTYPRLATPLTYVTRDELLEVCTEILKIQRDYGNRQERRYARFKYLLDHKGMDWFRTELASRLGRSLVPPRELVWQSSDDHFGWHAHTLADGTGYLGLFIPSGRIVDSPDRKLKSTLRDIVREFQPSVRLTAQQNLIFAGLTEAARTEIEARLKAAHIPLIEEVSTLVKHGMSCVALPTCGLATTESERVFPKVLERFQALFDEYGLTDEPISIRMTGCPNGCARPYIADIAFVGRSPGKYDVMIGGDILGTRLNQLFRELVPFDELAETVRPVLAAFVEERQAAERFSDYCERVGLERFK
ncbi:NADPH-dependent assimilatory sulfite reductase hemoprotein subunit [Alicyclobacillus cycloheptanicus]|nr:NADPH-dependent assimilatory sulfite reductase hemoprotein subunit [Alicyclobacillus cycloheptanicus]